MKKITLFVITIILLIVISHTNAVSQTGYERCDYDRYQTEKLSEDNETYIKYNALLDSICNALNSQNLSSALNFMGQAVNLQPNRVFINEEYEGLKYMLENLRNDSTIKDNQNIVANVSENESNNALNKETETIEETKVKEEIKNDSNSSTSTKEDNKSKKEDKKTKNKKEEQKNVAKDDTKKSNKEQNNNIENNVVTNESSEKKIAENTTNSESSNLSETEKQENTTKKRKGKEKKQEENTVRNENISEQPATKVENNSSEETPTVADDNNKVKQETIVDSTSEKENNYSYNQTANTSEIKSEEPVNLEKNSTSETTINQNQTNETNKLEEPTIEQKDEVTPIPNQNLSEEVIKTDDIKSFSAAELENFKIKGMQKILQLEGFIKQIADKHTDEFTTTQVIESTTRLFENPDDRIVEVSTTKSPDKIRKKLKNYLNSLHLLNYDNVVIEWAEVNYASDFIPAPDGTYRATIVFSQIFEGYKDNIPVYRDRTTKRTEIILKKYNKEISGSSVEEWDVFLGDISVEHTE